MDPLSQQCIETLKANDRGTHTVPAPDLYPHQWLWDSCFAAVGWSHINVERAQKEIFNLIKGQWDNGMIPHIIFNNSAKYKGDRNMWRSWVSKNSPDHIATSGITQPPLIAEAVSKIGNQLKKQDRIQFYKKVLPALVKHHMWLYNDRDPHKQGLVFLIHPHETGMDNTPPWMNQLREHSWPWWITLIEKLHLGWMINIVRRDVQHVPPEQRAKNINAMVCWDIVRRLRRKQYNIEKILHRSFFVIQDIEFSSILIRNNILLKKIATEARIKMPKELEQNMLLSEKALEELWSDNFNLYFSRDFITNQLIQEPTIASLLPLYAGTISKEKASKLVKALLDKNSFWLKYPAPSVPKNVRDFDKNRYWQGPTWINTNWLIIDGLARYGFEKEATALKSSTIEMMRKNEIWEYYNPISGEGLGIKNFSWSAALALDILEQ